MIEYKDCGKCVNKSQCPMFGCLREHYLWNQSKSYFSKFTDAGRQIPPQLIWKTFQKIEPPKVSEKQKRQYIKKEREERCKINGLLPRGRKRNKTKSISTKVIDWGKWYLDQPQKNFHIED